MVHYKNILGQLGQTLAVPRLLTLLLTLSSFLSMFLQDLLLVFSKVLHTNRTSLEKLLV
jgi:hypothetical protein